MSADRLIDDARACYRAAVHAVQPARLMDNIELERLIERPIAEYHRVVTVGTGKASMAMAGVLEDHLPPNVLEGGLVVVPHGYVETLPAGVPAPRHIEVAEGGHPLPDRTGAEVAARALAMAEACTHGDLLIVLVSGGGSALWPASANDISLEDAGATFQLLLESGCDIYQTNAVRKHLSRIGGGRLARIAHPAEVIALVISDVVGDDLSVIASGPTVPDPSSFDDAVQVLRTFHLWDEVPEAVRRHLRAGLDGAIDETPGIHDPVFERSRTILIGGNRDALKAARDEATARGYRVVHLEEQVTGEARDVGRRQAEQVLAAMAEHDEPVCLLWGGETTVTVKGDGTGGRNQELALAAALALDDADTPVAFLSGGTDGIDGPTDAAGACVTPQTVTRARRNDLDAADYLDRNDSYPLLDRLDLLLRPGPTHTNALDVQIALARRSCDV